MRSKLILIAALAVLLAGCAPHVNPVPPPVWLKPPPPGCVSELFPGERAV